MLKISKKKLRTNFCDGKLQNIYLKYLNFRKRNIPKLINYLCAEAIINRIKKMDKMPIREPFQ
jgi:hypothetical protein